MKVRLVPSVLGDAAASHQYLTSYILNDTVAIDAGALGYFCSWTDQARIEHVFLTHSHIDHVGSLPIFLENIYREAPDCVTIHGSEAVLASLKRDIFNSRVWPDFISLSTPGAPFLKLSTLRDFVPVQANGLKITPIPVDHVVPTQGFLIESAEASILIVSDTGPTTAIWERANAVANLKAVFLEATFPESLVELAGISKHLTPPLFAKEVGKLRGKPGLYAVHIKARYYEEVVAELNALGLPNFQLARFDRAYEF